MTTGFVGFWIQYKYDVNTGGGSLSVGLNGAPFSSDYALLRWTDTTDGLRNIKYMGFTATEETNVEFGTNCVLLNTAIGIGQQNPFVQIQPNQIQQQQQQNSNGFTNLNQIQPQFSLNSLPVVQNIQSQFQNNIQSQQQQPSIGESNRFGSQQIIQQQLPRPGSKPWLINNSHQGGSSVYSPMEVEIVTEPEQTIIEPVIRNQYLTKLKRLLPTFFEGIPKEDMEAILARKRMQKVIDKKNQETIQINNQGTSNPLDLSKMSEEEENHQEESSGRSSSNHDTSTIRAMLESLHVLEN